MMSVECATLKAKSKSIVRLGKAFKRRKNPSRHYTLFLSMLFHPSPSISLPFFPFFLVLLSQIMMSLVCCNAISKETFMCVRVTRCITRDGALSCSGRASTLLVMQIPSRMSSPLALKVLCSSQGFKSLTELE
jgi:hypothetical protein